MSLRIHSATIGTNDVRWFAPNDPADVDVFLRVSIGRRGAKGADDFVLRVVTAASLARQTTAAPVHAARTLFVERWDPEAITTWIENTVASCGGRDWDASVEQLRRFFAHEYEGYRQ